MIKPLAHILLGLLLLSAPPAAAQAISALKGHQIDQPIEIAAQRLELEEHQDRAQFIGEVVVEQGDLTLKTDRLMVFYELAAGTADPTILRLDAVGEVVLASPSERASARWGVYDVERRLITLGGDVELERGDTRLSGDRLEIDLESGVTRLDGTPAGEGEGRVRGRFTLPEKTDGSK